MNIGQLPWWRGTTVSPAAAAAQPGPAMRRRRLLHRLAAPIAVLVGVPALTLSLAGGVADASGAGKITDYTGTGIDQPQGITKGPDGAMWFTN